MVYYRKYRSQTIDELDNSDIRSTLFSVLNKPESIPHAFLFTGPKGLGKTSTARIIAKVVNCESKGEKVKGKDKNTSIEPCNKCEQCTSITNGTNMDVLEIDAASNRGIDEIRDLKEKIRLAPLSARKKVYIIDEVHMLTTEAFNALLKTLEEPPEHSMFVLCTTEPHKVPSTILSRCFHIPFYLASPEELVRSFRRIQKGEKIDIDDEALQLIALLSEGGFRDGTKILEEVVSLANGKKITKELIEEKYKVSSIKYQVIELIHVLAIRDCKNGLQIIGRVVGQGIDVKYFLQQIIETLHQDLLVQVGVREQEAPLRPEGFAGQASSKNKELNIDEIRELIQLLSQAAGEMKNAVLPQLPLELAIVDWCSAVEPQKSQSTKLADDDNDENVSGSKPEENQKQRLSISGAVPVSEEVTVSSLRKQVGTITKIKALYGEPAANSKSSKPVIETTTVDLMHVPADGKITEEWQAALWRSIISEMKHHNHTIAGVLRGCTIKNFDQQQLIIQTAYKFHKERLDEMKTRQALIKVCKMLTGKDVVIEVELKK